MFSGFYLLVSILTLGLGPIVVRFAGRVQTAIVVLDAYVLIVVAGLVGVHVLPHSLHDGGWWAVVAAVVGCVVPLLAERGMRPSRGTRGLTIALALSGLFVHAMIDGAAIAGFDGGHAFLPGNGEGVSGAAGEVVQHGGHYHAADGSVHALNDRGAATLWAVLAHRLPVGIGIWWIVGRTLGRRIAILTLLVTALGTVAGWLVGMGFPVGGAIFQALLAGSLLHVLLHAHVPAPKNSSPRLRNTASVLGGLLAIATVWIIEASHSHGAVGDVSPGMVFMTLLYESAPVLLVVYFAAGVAAVFVPASWVDRMNRGSTLSQSLRGIAVGLPLPICSCGVVPIYRSLIARGASTVAAIGFLIATPELEIAAVLITMELLGPEIAIARVVSAALLALFVAVVVGKALGRGARPVAVDSADVNGDARPGAGDEEPKLRAALRIGFVDMVDQTAAWILLGLGISAMLAPHLDPSVFAKLPNGLDVPTAALLGLPIYVCASGSTPLVAVFVAQGLSPGAGLAFLLTGPATNVTTFGVLSSLHGTRAAWVFAISAFCGAVGLGYATNGLLPAATLPALDLSHAHGTPSALTVACVAALGLLVFASLLRNGTRGFISTLFGAPHDDDEAEAETGGACCH